MKREKSALLTILLAGIYMVGSPAMATYNHSYNCDPNTSQTYPTECDAPLGDNTYNLITDGIKKGTDSSVDGAININNVDIVVSSWSDTYTNNDDIVVSAELAEITDYYGNSYGYGVWNQDSESGWSGSPDHAVDNNYWEGGDTWSERKKYADFDFVLFSFSEAVTLTGANYGWAQTTSSSQVSVAALDDISLLTSGSNTWSTIATNALAKNSFDIEECETGYTSPFNFTASAKYWLVGAYNVAFGNITNGQTFNDAFKLAAVGFNKSSPNNPSNEVSAPGTLGLFLLSGLAVAMRKRRRS